MDVKSLLLYDGLEKTKYESVKTEIHEQNRKNLVLYISVLAAFLFGLFVFSFFSEAVMSNRYVYFGCLIVALIMLLFLNTVAKRNITVILVINYLYCTLIFAFSIVVGTYTSPPDQLAVSMCVCVALIPFLSYDIQLRSILHRAIMLAIFIIIAVRVKTPEAYTKDTINIIGYGLIGTVCNLIVQSIQSGAFYLRYNLKKEVAESTKQLKDLSHESIMAFATAIDAKDSYTNGHSLRVADYSKMLAKKLGKTAREQEEIYYVALLHDVGKIGIPDGIINKAGQLTDEEYEKIKSHSLTGYNILKNIEEMPLVAIGAKYHHEKYDGTGYPEGIAGNDIPEIARIIAVADAYDAMTSTRSYRKTMSQEQVYQQIKEGKGSQFDPKVAQMMLVIIENDKNYELHG